MKIAIRKGKLKSQRFIEISKGDRESFNYPKVKLNPPRFNGNKIIIGVEIEIKNKIK